MKKLFLLLTFTFLLLTLFCLAQKKKIDSLLILLKADKEDTSKSINLNELSSEYNKIGSYDSAVFYAKSALQLCNAILKESKNITVKTTSQKSKASAYYNIGNSYWYQGNYSEALKYYIFSLKIYEAIKDKSGIAASYDGIAFVNSFQGNYSEALKNYYASLKIYEAIDNKKGIAGSYNGIGIVYSFQGNFPKALKNFFASLKIKEAIGDKSGIASSYNNIGEIYAYQGDYFDALKNFMASLKIMEAMGDKAGIAASYSNIGIVSTKQKQYNKAEEYLIKSKILSIEIGLKDNLKYVYKGLTELDSAKGNFKGAFENNKLYTLYRDSLNNEETHKKTIQSQLVYEFEKKDAVAYAEHKKELENQHELADEKSRKQKVVILFVVIGLLLVLVFAGFILRTLKITRKQKSTIEKQKLEVDEKNQQLNRQNEEISTQRDEIVVQRDLVTHQKEHIEEIHKEVTDSINYAKRIQDAVLPVSIEARSVLGDYFVLFKPKDIVSGDFYFTTKVKNWLIVAVADCTGHGVPGAFMSMLGISFLNEIVQKQELNKANQILNILRLEIINALQQKGVQGDQKDGMDISLLVLNTETNECQWAGANNPLYIISAVILNDSEESNSKIDASTPLSMTMATPQNDNKELIELKGDKMPIAIYPEMKDFTNHEFVLSKGDSVYLFTDGYADQFGGPKGRKFMYKQFKEILLQNCILPMNDQKENLETAFVNWKGKNEQVDDITIIGVII